MLVSFVDQSRFTHLGIDTTLFVNSKTWCEAQQSARPARRIAMEYTPEGALPRVSKVDGGTLEMVRRLGVEVVSSADLLQYATQRWSDEQLASHLFAAEKLTQIVEEAFEHIGFSLDAGITEFETADSFAPVSSTTAS